MPDNASSTSSHQCKLKIPLPAPANKGKGYVPADLRNHSLIAVRLLVAAGCEVRFTKDEYIVIYKGKIIMRGTQNKSNGLWYVPISNKAGKQ